MFEGNNGKVKEMLEEIGNDHITNSAETPIRGNAFETMLNIDMLGDQVVFGSGGMCGYNQHFPLPVGLGGPYVRIQNVTVGGKS